MIWVLDLLTEHLVWLSISTIINSTTRQQRLPSNRVRQSLHVSWSLSWTTSSRNRTVLQYYFSYRTDYPMSCPCLVCRSPSTTRVHCSGCLLVSACRCLYMPFAIFPPTLLASDTLVTDLNLHDVTDAYWILLLQTGYVKIITLESYHVGVKKSRG
jgi:hypothetical protein